MLLWYFPCLISLEAFVFLLISETSCTELDILFYSQKTVECCEYLIILSSSSTAWQEAYRQSCFYCWGTGCWNTKLIFLYYTKWFCRFSKCEKLSYVSTQNKKRPIRRVKSPSAPRAWLSRSYKPKFGGHVYKHRCGSIYFIQLLYNM